MIDDLRSLQYFVLAAQCGSFTAAAARLGITPAAVSRCIMRLEAQLNTRLFNRTTRQLHLTDAGRRFMQRAAAAIGELDRGVEELAAAQNRAAGLLRISTITSFGKRHVIPLLPAFLARHPDVDVEVSFDEGKADLVAHGFDVGIRRGQSGDASYVSRSLCTLPLVVVASPAYLAGRGVPACPEDLRRHDCIGVRLPSGMTPKWEFGAEAGASFVFEPHCRLVVSAQLDAVVDAALAGLGVTTLIADTVLSHLQRGDLKLLLADWPVRGDTEIFLQYPHRDYLAFRVRVMVDYLVAHFQDIGNRPYDRTSLAAFAASPDA